MEYISNLERFFINKINFSKSCFVFLFRVQFIYGSDIVTPDEFRDSQVRYLKESKNNKYISDAILLGKGSNPKDVEGIFDDITQHVVII